MVENELEWAAGVRGDKKPRQQADPIRDATTANENGKAGNAEGVIDPTGNPVDDGKPVDDCSPFDGGGP